MTTLTNMLTHLMGDLCCTFFLRYCKTSGFVMDRRRDKHQHCTRAVPVLVIPLHCFASHLRPRAPFSDTTTV